MACLPLGVVAALVVVRAKVSELFTGAQQMPDDVEQAVSDSHGSLVGAASTSDLSVLGAEVAALGASGRASRLNQCSA